MEIPSDQLAQFSSIWQNMKSFTLMVSAECHAPDYQTMQEKIREMFSKLEAETFQLKLFDE